jgi:hypothetical protein
LPFPSIAAKIRDEVVALSLSGSSSIKSSLSSASSTIDSPEIMSSMSLLAFSEFKLI